MALFGRETQADIERAERIKAWLGARSPYALFAMMFGLLSVVDSLTMIIGFISGIVAIILSFLARSDIKANPGMLGLRLCNTALVLGILGVALSITVYFLLH